MWTLPSGLILWHNAFMQKLSILHTNDIHGNARALARVATLRQQLQHQRPQVPVVYVDAGDSLDKHAPLSKATRGRAMYELLKMARCQVSVLGNKCIKRWGMDIVAEYAAHVPIVVGNLAMPDGGAIPGTVTTYVLPVNNAQIGFLGVTAYDVSYIKYHNLQTLPLLSSMRQQCRELRETHRVDTVIVLSHLGLYDDIQLARALHGDVELIIGGHSHSLLPHGIEINGVSIAQAGSHGQFLGRIDLIIDDHLIVERMTVHPLHDSIVKDIEIATRIDELETALQLNTQ
jgi:2',3'-cyclic-nucleotide 2'-phosphodiesterase (5'-nucleotidase family)